MVTADEVKAKLAKYVINRKSHPHIPPTLDGEILLEEHRDEKGRLRGVITVSAENLANILSMRDDPTLRPDEIIESGPYEGKNVRDLTASEFEDFTSHKKYLDAWRAEGIDI